MTIISLAERRVPIFSAGEFFVFRYVVYTARKIYREKESKTMNKMSFSAAAETSWAGKDNNKVRYKFWSENIGDEDKENWRRVYEILNGPENILTHRRELAHE